MKIIKERWESLLWIALFFIIAFFSLKIEVGWQFFPTGVIAILAVIFMLLFMASVLFNALEVAGILSFYQDSFKWVEEMDDEERKSELEQPIKNFFKDMNMPEGRFEWSDKWVCYFCSQVADSVYISGCLDIFHFRLEVMFEVYDEDGALLARTRAKEKWKVGEMPNNLAFVLAYERTRLKLKKKLNDIDCQEENEEKEIEMYKEDGATLLETKEIILKELEQLINGKEKEVHLDNLRFWLKALFSFDVFKEDAEKIKEDTNEEVED